MSLIRNLCWLAVLAALGVAALWHFGGTRPIEIGHPSNDRKDSAVCRTCSGTGTITCPQCGGFGSTETQDACPACGGKGKIESPLNRNGHYRCPTCRGRGVLDARIPCSRCQGLGHLSCPSCGATGILWTTQTTRSRTLTMGHSLWERFLLLLRFPIESNPCPQREATGGYPIVDRYLALHSSTKQTGRVQEWGEFRPHGSAWRMTGQVEFRTPTGSVQTKNIEFTVHNRELVQSRVVQ